MSESEQCPLCGGRLAEGSAEGLCARCLLTAALRHPVVTATVNLPEPGAWVGQYRIVRLLGEGGMGLVYLAEQEEPIARQVALKIIKLGMDTRAVLSRFQSEQQALALMDHPNIAQVYEAGSRDDGRPYFVMEYVPGVPITQYCDQHKLDTRQRLELFLHVAHAVQHAHQKGVIHRDLKPSNVLVMERDGEAVPKIIDFGLAKATEKHLTEETLFTEAGALIGTPEYMSPEQAEMSGLDIDTRTDIYSLGVVLYELLTGTLPFDADTLRSAAFAEVQRIIREEEPLRPSTRLSTLGPEAQRIAEARRTDIAALARSLQKELEWIPLKAMRKDRTRRYRSAYEFSDDIRNYLDGRPLLAGPESAAYRLRKLLQKYRVPVATAAAIVAILLIGFVTSTGLYIRGQRAQHAVATLERTVDADRKLSTAQRLQAEGRYKESLDVLDDYLRDGQAEPTARLLHANLLYALDRFDEAQTELTGLIEGPPQIAGPAHCLLATIHMGSDPAKAQIHQQAGESLLPRTAEAYALRGMTADGSTATVEWLSKALELDPAYYPARKARALACEAVGDYATMATDAEAMIVMRPKDALGYALRAIVRREAGQHDSAMEDHNRAISLCDSPAELLELRDQRRRTLTQMHDYQAALQDARYCAAARPNDLRSGFELLAALVLAGDYPGAREQHAQLVRQPRYSFYKLWIYRYTFRLLIAGHSLTLPEDIVREEPFSLMQKAIDQYHVCRTLGTCLVPWAFGVPGWSPDGKELAYGRIDLYGLRSSSPTSGAPLVYEPGRLEVLEIETGRVRVLAASGKTCAWSPDGRWIAFDRVPNRGPAGCASELWIVSSAGEQPRFLSRGDWPNWAGRMGQLFYHSGGRAYSLNIDDPLGKPESIVSCDPYFAVSPDGKYLAHSEADRLSVVEVSSGRVKTTWTAPPPDGEHGMALRWAPNGREVLAGGLHQGEMGLWSFDVEQGKAWQLFPSPVVLGHLSPDGSRIALELRDWYGGLWLARLDAADSVHAAVRSSRTQEQYLRQSCREFAGEIRRGTYGSDAGSHLYGFITRVGGLCETYYHEGRWADALDTFESLKDLCDALDWQPSGSAAARAAMSLHQLDRQDEARAALERLRRLPAGEAGTPQRGLMYEAERVLAGEETGLGRLWHCLEEARIDDAARIIPEIGASEEAGRVRAAVAEAFYERGKERRYSGGNYKDTITDYTRAVELDPNHAAARCDLAWLQAACPVPELRDTDQAVANATRACELTHWTDHRYLAALAAVSACVGDFASAVSWQKKAIELLTDENKSCWRGDYDSRLHLYTSGRPYTQGSMWSFSTGRMLGWWRLDEPSGSTAADASGNGNDGLVTGSPQWEPSTGRAGGTLLVRNGSVQIGQKAPFNVTEAITISVWTRVETLDKWWQALVTKGDTSWRLHRSGDADCLEFACNGPQSSSGGAASAKSNRVLSDGRWHHVVATYDGSRIALYFDGELDAYCSAWGRLQTNDQPVCIGDNAEQPGRYWNGRIDDVRIYSYALNDAEVAELYEAGQQSASLSDR